MNKTLVTLLKFSVLALSTLPAYAIPITQNLTFNILEARTGSLDGIGFAGGLAIGAANYIGFDQNLGQLDSVELRLRGTHTVSNYFGYVGSAANQNPVQSVLGSLTLLPPGNDLSRLLGISMNLGAQGSSVTRLL